MCDSRPVVRSWARYRAAQGPLIRRGSSRLSLSGHVSRSEGRQQGTTTYELGVTMVKAQVSQKER